MKMVKRGVLVTKYITEDIKINKIYVNCTIIVIQMNILCLAHPFYNF